MSTTEPETPKRRTQAERRAETREALLSAARELFIKNGFADTGTPELVANAGVTRGALYHHFTDKTDVFRALAMQEAQAIGTLIDEKTRNIEDPEEAMIAGTLAYFDAMAVPGRAKLLLSDAPSILGHAEALELTKPEGSAELKDGLRQAIPDLGEAELDALTNVLSASFDRAALEIAEGADSQPYIDALFTLVGKAMG
ncbi:MAG: TetR/AcrR family transcriptional regulator [Litoreibacter sp.]|nr:TetR/AcrR family transcriptional regulator [Litoreibacter sp.]MCY4335255.1 TetR/AcrR family transcriptional regulator [Litoreibacter sp.]